MWKKNENLNPEKKEKLKPVLCEKSTKLLNLKVLQRIDPCVQEILTAAAHVAMYQYNTDTDVWSRKDVEGSLFVVKRNAQPHFQFTVLNRRSTENLVESLLGDFVIDVQSPYLLYRNHSGEVNGIWFYNPEECGEIANLFRRILDEYSEVSKKPNVSSIKSEVETDVSLEPSSTATANVADLADDQSSAKISSPRESPTALASPSLQSITLDTLLSAPAPAPVSSPSTFILSSAEHTDEPAKKCATDLVMPSSFLSPHASFPDIMPPRTSIVPPASPLVCPGNLKRPYGALSLPPFPPPPSPQSLTPTSVPSPTYGPFITREKIRKALQLLIQDNQFIDIVYRAVLNAPDD